MTITDPHPAADRRDDAGYELRSAVNNGEIVAIQRLRRQVFAAEFGASTPGADGMDRDSFDDKSDHLIIWHHKGREPAIPVATCRLLPPYANDAMPPSAGLCASTEFDLSPLAGLLDQTLEAGRSCVHPDHRTGAAISLLWAGIARYLDLTGCRYLVGCVSISMADGGHGAAAFDEVARTRYAADPQRWCTSRNPPDFTDMPRRTPLVIPALIRGYLRLGALICSEPFVDDHSRTAEFLVLLDTQNMNERYSRHFFGSAV